MQKGNWKRIEQIFNQAVVLTSGQRLAYVERECGGEENLFSEIITLLSADSRSHRILKNPATPRIGELLRNNLESFIERENFAGYKLLKLLGQGGAGAVFLAEDERLKRLVAIKILPSLSGQSANVQRFQKEARAASAVVHQNVAHIYEFGVDHDIHYLAMEYVAGKTLRQKLCEGAIKLSVAIEIALQIAQALRAAHKKDIFHRDIKPENLILTDENQVKVLDFGLAKLGAKSGAELDSELKSIPGLLLGTTAYMSPEQIRADEVDGKSDLWSLGVIFYEMLAGARPFQGKTASDVQAAVLLSEPAPLPPNDKPPCIGKIIEKLLVKDAAMRYQSADELIEDLRDAQREVYDFANKRTLSGRVADLFKGVLKL